MKIPPIDTHDGRRAFAFLATFGGAVVFTAFAAVATYLLRDVPHYLFWHAVGVLVLLGICITALGWAMGRRVQIKGGKDGVEVNDSEGDMG